MANWASGIALERSVFDAIHPTEANQLFTDAEAHKLLVDSCALVERDVPHETKQEKIALVVYWMQDGKLQRLRRRDVR
jgi:hypothetical protein